MATKHHVVLPGDPIDPSLIPTSSKRPLRLGPGLRHIPPSDIVPTVAGQLITNQNKNSMWIEYNSQRYIPSVNDLVLAQVLRSTSDFYLCSLSPHTSPATLPHLAFESATKKTRPILSPGQIVYARVTLANKHMDPELECYTPSTGRADGLGPITGPGCVFDHLAPPAQASHSTSRCLFHALEAMPSRSSQGVRVASSRLEPDPRVSQQQNNDNMVDAEESAGEETYTAPTIFCWTREAGSNQINLVINMPGGEAEWKGSENTLVVPEIVHSCKQPNGDYTIILGVASRLGIAAHFAKLREKIHKFRTQPGAKLRMSNIASLTKKALRDIVLWYCPMNVAYLLALKGSYHENWLAGRAGRGKVMPQLVGQCFQVIASFRPSADEIERIVALLETHPALAVRVIENLYGRTEEEIREELEELWEAQIGYCSEIQLADILVPVRDITKQGLMQGRG
ncbi:hypothetical protein VTJ04DRAFT_2635 [Mycothermus thermophilus]|uniref:uncharacterized protein n=1 Tax=Humicola insolens TaxID=85995 RepID=UPI003743CFA6